MLYRWTRTSIGRGVLFSAAVGLLLCAVPMQAETPADPVAPPVTASAMPRNFRVSAPCQTSELGSPYIPVDSWMYDSLTRLYSLGYVDTAFLGLRPWTRSSVIHMLEETSAALEDAPADAATDEAQELYDKLWHELNIDAEGPCRAHRGQLRFESAYTVARGITGTPLHDSWHLGETITNDYGRPYENGFNNYSGVSGYATAGIFSAYVRTEFQYASSGTGYSQGLFDLLSTNDGIPVATNPKQDTIPLGPIGSMTNARLVEGYVAAQPGRA